MDDRTLDMVKDLSGSLPLYLKTLLRPEYRGLKGDDLLNWYCSHRNESMNLVTDFVDSYVEKVRSKEPAIWESSGREQCVLSRISLVHRSRFSCVDFGVSCNVVSMGSPGKILPSFRTEGSSTSREREARVRLVAVSLGRS